MQSETLAHEFARLVKEYHEGDDHTKPEAWNLLADYAVDNAAAISAALFNQERAVEVKPLLDPHDFASAYEFRDECGDYTPTAADRAMIEDAVNGYLSELQSARRKLAEAMADLTSEHVFADTDPEAQWLKDNEDACPHCGGSGHKDDVRSALVDVPVEKSQPLTKPLLCLIGLHDYVPTSWMTCQPNNTGLVCRRCLEEKPIITPAGRNAMDKENTR